MKKFWIQIFFLLLIILGCTYYTFNKSGSNIFGTLNQSGLERKELRVSSSTITVEIADSPQKRNQGLSGRVNLDPNSGMLFVYPDKDKHRFWMKDMKFPLDFIFIRDGSIVDMIANVPIPLSGQKDSSLPIYEPIEPINMMLEVNSGFILSNNVKVGDKVTLVSP